MSRGSSADQHADRIASRQHGAIARRQALAAGLSPDQIEGRSRSGRWRIGLRQVYVAAGAPSTWRQRAMVACLAGPEGTVVSHLTGAALLTLSKPPEVPHVTVPPGTSGRFRGAVVHHSPLDPVDICTADAIPCTRPARTVVDCAALLTYEALCEMVDDLLCRAPHTPSSLRDAMARVSERPGRKGLRNLERALAVWTPGPRPGSRAEMRVVRQLVAWGLPVPERQVEIFDEGGGFVARGDLGYREGRIILEYYGEPHHGPRSESHDRFRQEQMEAAGVRVVVVDKDNLRSPALQMQLFDLLGRRAG